MDSEYCNSLVNAAEALSEEDLMKDRLSDYPFEIPDEIPVDIRAKMTICLIHCKANPEKIQVRKLVEAVNHSYSDLIDYLARVFSGILN